MSAVTLLGECSECSKRVYSRADSPDVPEWYRRRKGPMLPHRHDPRRYGKCTVCTRSLFNINGVDKVRRMPGQRGPKFVVHRHNRPFKVEPIEPYRLKPVREPEPDHGWRGWMDYADRMGAL